LAFAGPPAARIRGLGTSQSLVPQVSSRRPGPARHPLIPECAHRPPPQQVLIVLRAYSVHLLAPLGLAMAEKPDNEPISLERRRVRRERLLLRAKLVIGDGVYDCILLDQTAAGARLETLLPVALPERFSLRFPDGRQLACERRWTSGRRLGVEIVRTAAAGDGPQGRAAALQQAFDAMGVNRFFDRLRSENYLQNTALGEAAWQAEAAIRKLGLLLQDMAQDKPPGAPGSGTPGAER